MSDAMSDVFEYWRRKCIICKERYPVIHELCGENSYKCTKDIDIYHSY